MLPSTFLCWPLLCHMRFIMHFLIEEISGIVYHLNQFASIRFGRIPPPICDVQKFHPHLQSLGVHSKPGHDEQLWTPVYIMGWYVQSVCSMDRGACLRSEACQMALGVTWQLKLRDIKSELFSGRAVSGPAPTAAFHSPQMILRLNSQVIWRLNSLKYGNRVATD